MSRAAIVARSIALATIASLALPIDAADAHHAWNEIDTAKTMTLVGTVESLKWENPHASLVLRSTDGATSVEWTVMMSGIARMEGRGVTASVVAVGRSLTIVASPARDEAHVVRANRIRVDGNEYVLY